MNQPEIILEEGKFYHIYTRGINGTNLFYEERNYTYFLTKYAHYLGDVLDTYAYCLMKNHFHLLVSVKQNLTINPTDLEDQSGLTGGLHSPNRIVSKKFSDFFNSYSKSINSAQNRTGGLFETPFRRILVDSDAYFSQLVWYIHFNPQKHGFVNDYRVYPHSSYHSHLSEKSTKLEREKVISWFGNKNTYTSFHSIQHDESDFSKFLFEND
jgi:putative transposase